MNNDQNIHQDEDQRERLPAPTIEDVEQEWAVLGCSCDCDWGD